MSNFKDLIFYFTFCLVDENDDENDIEKTYGFYVEKIKFNNDFEDFLSLLPTSDIEREFGIHDWSTRPVAKINAIGYCSYEVENDQINSLMKKWRKTIKDLIGDCQVSKIYLVPEKQTHNDKTIQDFVKNKFKIDKIKKIKNKIDLSLNKTKSTKKHKI